MDPMVRKEHTHTILTLLGLLALLLLAVSVAGADGWQEGEGVRYHTYRTPPPAYLVSVPDPAVAMAPIIWVTPEGKRHHTALWIEPLAARTGQWGGTPLLLMGDNPPCPAPSKKGNPEEG
jgi:hypothetical protein